MLILMSSHYLKGVSPGSMRYMRIYLPGTEIVSFLTVIGYFSSCLLYKCFLLFLIIDMRDGKASFTVLLPVQLCPDLPCFLLFFPTLGPYSALPVQLIWDPEYTLLLQSWAALWFCHGEAILQHPCYFCADLHTALPLYLNPEAQPYP